MLTVINFHPEHAPDTKFLPAGTFYIKTCQRVLIFTLHKLDQDNFKSNASIASQMKVYTDTGALRYLLSVVCGLESQNLGEYEVMGQFRKAFNLYSISLNRNKEILQILQYVLRLAKKIRSHYLQSLEVQSYGGMAKKILLPFQGEKILILGTGSLAEEAMDKLKEKYQIVMSGRNQEKLKSLEERYTFSTHHWGDVESFLDYPFILNTIGTENKLFDDSNFFLAWAQRHHLEKRVFIDMGGPSPVSTKFDLGLGVYKLPDVLAQFELVNHRNMKQIGQAKMFIETEVNWPSVHRRPA